VSPQWRGKVKLMIVLTVLFVIVLTFITHFSVLFAKVVSKPLLSVAARCNGVISECRASIRNGARVADQPVENANPRSAERSETRSRAAQSTECRELGRPTMAVVGSATKDLEKAGVRTSTRCGRKAAAIHSVRDPTVEDQGAHQAWCHLVSDLGPVTRKVVRRDRFEINRGDEKYEQGGRKAHGLALHKS